MNRRLHLINLLGVVALVALCVLQWRRDRLLNLQMNQLENASQNQQQRIREQDEAARGLSGDLARFKEQFKSTHDELDEAVQKLRGSENENAKLAAEKVQLQETVTNWQKAVQQRDALVKEANDRIRGLSDDLNDSIRKFNELAQKYNAVVKELNESRKSPVPTNSP